MNDRTLEIHQSYQKKTGRSATLLGVIKFLANQPISDRKTVEQRINEVDLTVRISSSVALGIPKAVFLGESLNI